MIDSETEMNEPGRNPQKHSQQKIVDPNLSRMSQTSCNRKKPAGGRVYTYIHTHTHTHTHTQTQTHTHTYTQTVRQLLFVNLISLIS